MDLHIEGCLTSFNLQISPPTLVETLVALHALQPRSLTVTQTKLKLYLVTAS
jgi:hypothetical protein